MSILRQGNLTKIVLMDDKIHGKTVGKLVNTEYKSQSAELRNEFEILQKLQNFPNIISVYNLQTVSLVKSEFSMLTMEYAEKGDLFDFI